MATMTIRMPDDKHKRLQKLAASQGISVNRLVDDLAGMALIQHDAELRFHQLAAIGDPQEGLRLLDKLDRGFARRKKPKR